MNRTDLHYRGFIDTCSSFGIGKADANSLYKKALAGATARGLKGLGRLKQKHFFKFFGGANKSKNIASKGVIDMVEGPNGVFSVPYKPRLGVRRRPLLTNKSNNVPALSGARVPAPTANNVAGRQIPALPAPAGVRETALTNIAGGGNAGLKQRFQQRLAARRSAANRTSRLDGLKQRFMNRIRRPRAAATATPPNTPPVTPPNTPPNTPPGTPPVNTPAPQTVSTIDAGGLNGDTVGSFVAQHPWLALGGVGGAGYMIGRNSGNNG